MNVELKRPVNWLAASKLSLKESNAQLILFCPAGQHNHTLSNIKLNNFVLKPVKSLT